MTAVLNTYSDRRLYRGVTGYYPYGLPWANLQSSDRYLYSGKELERTAGENLYEMEVLGLVAQKSRRATINWNSTVVECAPDIKGQTSRISYIGLAHELGHAYDFVRGLLYYDGTAGCENYDPVYSGILKCEWNAVYHENRIRKDLKLPLRISYGIIYENGKPKPANETLMIDKREPIPYPPEFKY